MLQNKAFDLASEWHEGHGQSYGHDSSVIGDRYRPRRYKTHRPDSEVKSAIFYPLRVLKGGGSAELRFKFWKSMGDLVNGSGSPKPVRYNNGHDSWHDEAPLDGYLHQGRGSG